MEVDERQGGLEPLAVIAGLRTPFAKAFGALNNVPADRLGVVVTDAVLKKARLEPSEIDEVIFGNVAGPPEASNVSRVIALRAGIPPDRIAHTVNRNCASGMDSIFAAWQAIREGRADRVLAGGTESMSNIPLLWDERMKEFMLQWRRARRWSQKLKLLGRFRPAHLKPVAAMQLGLTDPVCGLNMGETGEVLAREFAVSREDQDRFALRSHRLTLEAWDSGYFDEEVVKVPADLTGNGPVERDIGPRTGQTMETLAGLRPLFDPKGGSLTAGNSCQITDGAAAVVVTSPEQADRLGHEPLGYVRGYSIAGCDPKRMGLGPLFAIDKLLAKSGLGLNDFELVEINEAFAAQVLAVLQAMNSDEFAQKALGRQQGLGELDMDRLNVHGGAIALGHPVGTSGTRLVITLLRALRERGLRRGLAALCVGGGQGAAVWVETSLEGA